HETHEAVSVEAVVQNLLKNVRTAKDVLRGALPTLAPPRTCACGHLLANAVITSPTAFPPKTRKRLAPLLDRYFPATGRRPGWPPRRRPCRARQRRDALRQGPRR